MSIVSNEVLHLYPKSYYVKWLNTSLIQGLWNHIFFLSNLALFILMPFAYFFTEAEGFSGSKKGLMSRVYETAMVLTLLAVVVLGIAWVASALINGDHHSKQQLFAPSQIANGHTNMDAMVFQLEEMQSNRQQLDTSMVKIILNCIVLLILSSALPIVSKMLGITNFDLIGNFGSMDWLGNFYLILTINIVFAAATALSLVTKFTAAVRQEIYLRLKAAIIYSDKKSQTPAATTTSGTNGAVKEEKEE
nr:hypothetical protein BaRGS_032570 [Batillaria attramentaria]KAG5707139.1 hypothetical protein BaRGS_011850 [Batillaria attramentaria]